MAEAGKQLGSTSFAPQSSQLPSQATDVQRSRQRNSFKEPTERVVACGHHPTYKNQMLRWG
jgi:hypothetical protein